jgi:hypothetical protein
MLHVLHLAILFSYATALQLADIYHKSTTDFHGSFQTKSLPKIEQTASLKQIRLKQGLLPKDMKTFFDVPRASSSSPHSLGRQKVQQISETFVEARLPDMSDITTLRTFGWMAYVLKNLLSKTNTFSRFTGQLQRRRWQMGSSRRLQYDR